MSDRPRLRAGDVISYSSGSTNRTPYGFRIAKHGMASLKPIQNACPGVLDGLAGRTPIVINAYPAYVGRFEFGITVDSYLSYTTASRALHLASVESLPVIMVGQPLNVTEIILRHIQQGHPAPDVLVLGVGGYEMPLSLEKMLRDVCAQASIQLSIFCGYGVAEVDASCLMASERNEKGEWIYRKRGPEIIVDVREGNRLFLGLQDRFRRTTVPPFDTTDFCRVEGKDHYLSNPERYHPNVRAILESWSSADWQRRTGYLHFGAMFRVQLRKDVEPDLPFEVEFFDYARKYGHQWLFKPQWNRIGGTRPSRRTLI